MQITINDETEYFFTCPYLGRYQTLTLGMEMVVADRWKGHDEVFHGETAWDFEHKSWEWKKE